MTPAALIFDLDGTLADTSAIWRKAEEQLFQAMGSTWDARVIGRCKGMNARDLAANVHGLLKSAADLAAMQDLMQQSLAAAYERGRAAPMPGAVELVRRLHGQAPMAVASGSPLSGIEATVDQLGIRACFDLLLTSEDVARGKPHPDVFLHAAKALGVAPAACLALEDSVVGTQAALAAGMRCIVCPQGEVETIRGLPAECVGHWNEVTVATVFGP